MGTPRFVIDEDGQEDVPAYSPVARIAGKDEQRAATNARNRKVAAKREAEIEAAAKARATEILQRPTVNGRIVSPVSAPVEEAPIGLTLPPVSTPTATDLPTLLVEETRKRVIDGTAKIAVRDGLAAQSILERRAERSEDRAFMLNLARALAGGGQSGPVPLLEPGPEAEPDEDIEAEFTELDDDGSLAPAHLRAPL
jgi:hypothetical protein